LLKIVSIVKLKPIPSSLNTVQIPTLNSHQLLIFLIQLSLLLTTALVLGSLARRYKMPALIGELFAGILLGPSVLGQINPGFFTLLFPQMIDQYHLLDAVGQLGVLLLVGLSGIGLNLSLLRNRGSAVTKIGLTAAIFPFICGFIVGYSLPIYLLHVNRLIFALFLGITMSVSAIPVMAKTLLDMNLLHRRMGQLALAAGTIDDTLGWLILSVVAAMTVSGGINPQKFAESLILIFLFLFISWFVVRRLIHIILALFRNKNDEGPTVTAMVAMILGYAAITQAIGLEAVFGALVCGILIRSDAKFRSIRLPTILSVLAPLFFATVGLRINLSAFANPSLLVIAIIIVIIATVSKFSAAYIGSRLSGLKHWESFAIGAAMNARGVIEIVIANVGLQVGILNSATYTIIILVAIVTSILAAPAIHFAMLKVKVSEEE
jgi:Kef-type K+ transport system membrane component KefB